MKALILSLLVFSSTSAMAGVVFKYDGQTHSPAEVQTQVSKESDGVAFLVVNYSILGKAYQLIISSEAFKNSGYNASQLEDKILQAVNVGDARYMEVSSTKGESWGAQSYTVSRIAVATLASSSKK